MRTRATAAKALRPLSDLLRVRVQPKARRNEIVEQPDGVFRVRVTAAPEGGAANRAVIALLAEALDIAPSRVALVHGATSRDKLFRVEPRPLTLPSPLRPEGARK
jgi:uncharacterized protein (TIGR00251 family)